LSSSYPQPDLLKPGLPTASNIVVVDGVRVHMILHCTVEKTITAYGLSLIHLGILPGLKLFLLF
jgi:hypothetical protein